MDTIEISEESFVSHSEASIVTPPKDARVVVEGGHHTLRRLHWKSPTLVGPRCYFFEADAGTPPLQFEARRCHIEREVARIWVVLNVPDGETVSLPEGLARGPINTFELPTASEIRSLERAIVTAMGMQNNVACVELALMLGDLYVPVELRERLDWALPADYARALARAEGIPLVLLGESRCRNKAHSKIVEQAKWLLQHRNQLESLYEIAGCTILIDVPSDRTLYLGIDGLIDNHWTEYPIIALTKGESKPACATTIAGKLYLLSERRITHHIAWYDQADDDKIRQKNIEGFLIATCFFSDMTLDAQTMTTRGDRSQIDHLVMSELRRPGRRAGYDALEREAQRKARDTGMAFIGASAPEHCCVYPQTIH